ncbi:MAG: rod shape-determining protein MreD [Candidatus Eremiobacteraeota bacterium]|nr:rod shape-determining protein MreD [Candidatus Eremiobacteraeota bacterium]
MTRRRTYLILAIVLFFSLFQASFLHYFPLWGVRPDLVLILVAMLGLFNGLADGVAFGLAAGFIMSLVSTGTAGVFCLAYSLTAYLSALVKEKIHPDYYFVPAAVAAGATVLSTVLFVTSGALLRHGKNIDHIKEIIVPLIVMNVVLSIPMGFLVRTRAISTRASFE